jgi:hypothetical protein
MKVGFGATRKLLYAAEKLPEVLMWSQLPAQML